MRNQLRDGPVHVQAVAQGQAMRRQVLLAHGGGGEQYFQFDIQRTRSLVTFIQQVRQWLRVALRPRRLRLAERLQGLGGHHPR